MTTKIRRIPSEHNVMREAFKSEHCLTHAVLPYVLAWTERECCFLLDELTKEKERDSKKRAIEIERAIVQTFHQLRTRFQSAMWFHQLAAVAAQAGLQTS